MNNAGTSSVRPLDELTDAEWQAQWELHVMAPMRLMRALAPAMAAAGGGRIVNVSSSSGQAAVGCTNAAYSVTKAAELSLSRVFADTLARRGRAGERGGPGAGGERALDRRGGPGRPDRGAHGPTREEVLAATHAKPPLGRMGARRTRSPP